MYSDYLFDGDIDPESVPRLRLPRQTTVGLEDQVQSLQEKVAVLQGCLQDSLNLQRNLLEHWDEDIRTGRNRNPFPPRGKAAVATSTPYIPTSQNQWPGSGPNPASMRDGGNALQEKVEEACLERAETVKLLDLLQEFDELLDGRLGCTSLTKHVINSGDAKPINLLPYRTSPMKKRIIEKEIKKMLDEGIIEPAVGPSAAPIVIVPKPSDEVEPLDPLPHYAVLAGLDLRSLAPMMLNDHSQLRQLQLDDPETGPLLRDLENASGGGEERQQYVLQEGLLYFNDPKLFFWPLMNSDIKTYVITCKLCQFSKPSQRKPAGLMIPIHPQRPWEYVGVDYISPLPRTQNGNAYLLVLVDYFSKWVEANAVKEATAQVAASKFLCDIFARHGAPTYLISDRGSPFIAQFFEHVLSALGTKHRLTTAYHPQTNATERVNRTLETAIRSYVGDKHTSWDKYILQICFVLRTAPHESTGLSPAMMLYGLEMNTPLDLISQPTEEGMEDPEVAYPETLQASLQEAHDHAKAALDASHCRQKKYYDVRRHPVNYKPDDLVRVKTHPRSEAVANFTAKLAPLYSGPYRVTKKLSEVNY
ncbi:hypothetical protein SKAU_G00286670 [Synaphobranchus kaupii]|uniref:Integrase catalytic domain-containing protein n=1 Tax=Synaphobranchus kaupii TaxID=118154 RepID=A0A9Q1EY53_SYNKA|nr:hypothetical protein SKAU_G00286670 [Synaphobranchus kaupii]